MSHRCINAFAFEDKVFGNGIVVADDDPILTSHGDHFAEVDEIGAARAVEQAVAEPGGLRAAPRKKAPAKKAAPAKAVNEEKGEN